MTAYPHVLGELATLEMVLSGKSIARYGDGELKMASRLVSIKSQSAHPVLSRRLREILYDSGECLVGIPNIHSPTPKIDFWRKYRLFADVLNDKREYVSSFITRPDSAPWLDVPEYWDKVESLWRGQDVTLVRGSSKSLVAEDLIGAGVVTEVIAPRQHAFAEYDSLLRRIGRPKRALLCLGPSATVMAVDLCASGVHAIDLGHIGMFMRKHRRGEPMWVSESDKVAV